MRGNNRSSLSSPQPHLLNSIKKFTDRLSSKNSSVFFTLNDFDTNAVIRDKLISARPPLLIHNDADTTLQFRARISKVTLAHNRSFFRKRRGGGKDDAPCVPYEGAKGPQKGSSGGRGKCAGGGDCFTIVWTIYDPSSLRDHERVDLLVRPAFTPHKSK